MYAKMQSHHATSLVNLLNEGNHGHQIWSLPLLLQLYIDSCEDILAKGDTKSRKVREGNKLTDHIFHHKLKWTGYVLLLVPSWLPLSLCIICYKTKILKEIKGRISPIQK